MGDPAPTDVAQHVTCPFCGILCDDLEVARSAAGLEVRRNGCEKAVAGFARAIPAASPEIAGKPATLAAAIAEAARLLKASRQPLFGGLGTDVQGMRAVMSIADRSGGVVDHALSEGQFRNFRVLQTQGWFMSTLTETRNRADMIVIVGSDVHKLHPRFFERIVTPEHTMFDDAPKSRSVVFIGKGLDQSGAKGPHIAGVTTLGCAIEDVGQVMAALKAVLRGTPLAASSIAGVPVTDIKALAERCRKASYPVFVWAPPSLSFPNAELVVGLVSELVKELNLTGRAACLSLGGNEGAVSAGAVCGWQSGFPLRVSFNSGKPHYDPLHYSIPRMLANGEGDLLVWIASFTPDLAPPATKVPTVVLGTPGVKLTSPPAVMIPVGTPGADHAGLIVRCDNVVSLPLKNLKRAALPSAADVLAQIEALL